MNEAMVYEMLEKINRKINIIIVIFILFLIYSYWLYLQAGSFLTMADILMDRAQMYGDLIFKGNHR